MDGKVSGVILVAAFLLAAGMCAMLALKLWRAGAAGRSAGRGDRGH
jgi:hypothetical protein